MGISMKVSGAWKAMKAAHVNVGGTWKQCKNAYVRVSGKWYALMPTVTALASYSNGKTQSKTLSNVRVGSIITVTYNTVNGTYDASDYAYLSWTGCTLVKNANGTIIADGRWNMGPKAGAYSATFKATAASVTFSVLSYGMSSGTGSASYYVSI